jgi:hypothetical protein
VYSNKALFEPDTLIDQMRCACCRRRRRHRRAAPAIWYAPNGVQARPPLPDPRLVRCMHSRVHEMRDGTDVLVADPKRTVRS